MRSEPLTKDIATINDLIRDRVAKAGGTYVDIWPGFVDDRNRFTMTGPDLEGQEAKLRDVGRRAFHQGGLPQGRAFRRCRTQASHGHEPHGGADGGARSDGSGSPPGW